MTSVYEFTGMEKKGNSKEEKKVEEGEKKNRFRFRKKPKEEKDPKPSSAANVPKPKKEADTASDESYDPFENRNVPKPTSPKKEADTASDESYDPFEHRNVPKPTSDFGALAHLLKTSLGSGILAMPMAFKNAGLAFGAVGTIVLGIICTHCVQLLVSSSQVLCKRTRVPELSYSKTAHVAFETGPYFAKKVAKLANIIITVELLLSFILGNTVYVVFMSQSFSQVCEHYFEPGIDIRLYVLSLWLPLILMNMFRNLKSLVPFSIIANIFVTVSFSITLYYIFRQIKPTTTVYLVAPLNQIPLFLSTVIFAIEGIGTVLPIEHEMKNPQHFLKGRIGIIYIAMTIVVAIYGIIGFFGYLQYGQDTRGSITLNLPVNDIEAQLVKILIALAIFFTYALQFYVPINILWELVKDRTKPKYEFWVNTGIRVGLVTLTIVAAIAIPNLEPIISLVGAICFSMLGMLLPALIDIMTRWPVFGWRKWILVKNILIVIVSIIALVSGTYKSLMDIVKTYS